MSLAHHLTESFTLSHYSLGKSFCWNGHHLPTNECHSSLDHFVKHMYLIFLSYLSPTSSSWNERVFLGLCFVFLLHPTMNYAYENQVHICFITSVIPTSWLKCGSIIDFTLKICYTLLVILKHLLNIKVLCCVWMLVPLTIIMSKMFVVPSFL